MDEHMPRLPYIEGRSSVGYSVGKILGDKGYIIPYRAKESAESETWHEGYLLYDFGDTAYIFTPGERLNGVTVDGYLHELHGSFHKVALSTIERGTGLWTKDGSVIFEGNILKCGDHLFVVRFGRCGGIQNVKGEVGYFGFWLEPYGKHAQELADNGLRTDILYWLDQYKSKIVGDIHDQEIA